MTTRTTFNDWYVETYPEGLPDKWVAWLKEGWDARYRTLSYYDL